MNDNNGNPPRHMINFGEPQIFGARYDISVQRFAGRVTILFDLLGAATYRGVPSGSRAVEVVIPIIDTTDNASVLIEMRGHGGTYSDGDALLIVNDGNLDQTVRFDEPRDFYLAWECPVVVGQPLRISLLVAARAGEQGGSDAMVQIDSIEIGPTLAPTGTTAKSLPTAERMTALR